MMKKSESFATLTRMCQSA